MVKWVVNFQWEGFFMNNWTPFLRVEVNNKKCLPKFKLLLAQGIPIVTL